MDNTLPKWHRELDQFRELKTTFIFEGNIYDLHFYPGGEEKQWIPVQLDDYFKHYLAANHYATIVYYNHVDGFYAEESHLTKFIEITGKECKPNDSQDEGIPNQRHLKCQKATLDTASLMIRTALGNKETPTSVILNCASRYITSPDSLNEEERQFYSRLFLTTIKTTYVKTEAGLINNLLFIVADKANDIPAWFYLDNHFVKVIHISAPNKNMRERFIDTQNFLGMEQLEKSDLAIQKSRFVDLTDGFKNRELNNLKILCKQRNIPIQRIANAISLYKYGIKESPWQDIQIEKLAHADEFIRQRVKGQDHAVTQSLDIIKRAVSGMSGLQHSSSSNKPRGILFFAGPTGTGKTEMAKTLASLLFGDDSNCIRFDMSEYQQSHSDQKLLGSPPGYVGYDAGGQLTNAIKEKPFSILLFDEIEKAHPNILDKFLQILEDGRMTDGRGETVYFSESIIIFTSNLGIYSRGDNGERTPNIKPGVDYKTLKERVLRGIKDYFVLDLGRPEILNRFGNNFVVFNYIAPETAHEIMESQLAKILNTFKEEQNVHVTISDEAKATLETYSNINLENGGRGIGNVIETYFINPLARYRFDNRILKDRKIDIKAIYEKDDVVHIDCEDSEL